VHGAGALSVRNNSIPGVRARAMAACGVNLTEVFGGSKVRVAACGYQHTLVVTEAGELWACGRGAQGRLGLNDGQDRLVPTRVDPQHSARAPISAVAAGDSHSAAVTAGGALYT
jgi:alpha-tubulin suppressor-like RCC1 family protein